MNDRRLEAHALYLMFNGTDINLKPEYFHDEEMKQIYELRLMDEQLNIMDKRIPETAVIEILGNDSDWFLMDAKATRKNLIDFYNRRKVQELSQNLMRDINLDYQKHLLGFELERITEVVESDMDLDLEELYIDLAKQNSDKDYGIKTGVVALDRMVGYIDPGDYVLIGARPSIGKSVLGKEIADYNLKCGRKTMIFSLEMTKQMYYKRWMFSTARIDQEYLKQKTLTKDHFLALEKAKEQILVILYSMLDDLTE